MEHPQVDDYWLCRINELEHKVSNLESEIEDKECKIEQLRERLQEEIEQNSLLRQENCR